MIFTLDSTAYDRGTFQMPHLSVHTALNSPAIDGNISLRDVKRVIWKTLHATRPKETWFDFVLDDEMQIRPKNLS